MGFMAPAIPWIVKGGAMLGGSLFAKHQQNAAMKRSPEEQQALQGAQSAATGLTTTGNQMVQQGGQQTQQAGNYWSTLLHGNRAAMSQATAGPRASITDTYRGAESNLERSGVQGANRQVASAELGRQRAGQIAGLTTGVQPTAAAALAQLGTSQASTGASLMSGAGNIWGNLLGHGEANRYYGRQQGQEAGQGVGGLIFDILNGTLGKFGPKPSLSGGRQIGSGMGLPIPHLPSSVEF